MQLHARASHLLPSFTEVSQDHVVDILENLKPTHILILSFKDCLVVGKRKYTYSVNLPGKE